MEKHTQLGFTGLSSLSSQTLQFTFMSGPGSVSASTPISNVRNNTKSKMLPTPSIAKKSLRKRVFLASTRATARKVGVVQCCMTAANGLVNEGGVDINIHDDATTKENKSNNDPIQDELEDDEPDFADLLDMESLNLDGPPMVAKELFSPDPVKRSRLTGTEEAMNEIKLMRQLQRELNPEDFKKIFVDSPLIGDLY